jgi:hypothetical protein
MKLSVLLSAPLIFLFVNGASDGPQYYFNDVSTTNLPIQAVSGPSMDVESADIDNDGDKDIIIAREFAPNKVLINNGSGIFTDESNRIPQFSYDSEDIGTADFDRDGDLDIIFASEDNAIHEFYLNRGNGFFDNANNRLPNFTSNALLIIDLNNDTYPDMIFGSNGASNPAPPGYAKVFMNNGNAAFTQDTTRIPRILMVPQDIKSADIDNDGDKDLVFACEDGNKIFVNDGTGKFNDETAARLPVNGNEESRKVALGDIDNNGSIDIFFANVNFRGGQDVQDRLLINNGAGVFTDVTSTNLPADFEQTLDGIFTDLNNDGKLDLIASNAFVNRPVKAFHNNGSGVFTEITDQVFPPTAVAEGLGITIDNFNNDTLPDLYIAHRRTTASGGNDKLLLRINPAVGINLLSSSGPENYKLFQNYPNPFNPSTSIKYNLKNSGHISLRIFSSVGKEIVELINEDQSAGSYSIDFNADEYGLTSGIYFYQLTIGKQSITKSMLLIK